MTTKSIWKPATLLMLLAAVTLTCAQREVMRADVRSETTAPQPEQQVVAQKHPEVDFSVSCLECHRETTPEVTAEWSAGMHGQVNIGCFVCHGDGEVEFYAKPKDERCIACHSAQEVDFTKVEATSCFSCHHGHRLKFHE